MTTSNNINTSLLVLEKRIGYGFENDDLLLKALTHSSMQMK